MNERDPNRSLSFASGGCLSTPARWPYQERSGRGVQRLKLKPPTEVSEAGSAHPVLAVSGRPSFELGIGVVVENVVPEVDPAKLAVVMVPVGTVRRPGPPLKGRSLEVTRLVHYPWIVLGSHASKSVIPRPEACCPRPPG